jgi:DNA polymerase III subunit epsilon
MTSDVARDARRLLESRPLFLDTETTGLGPRDQVIEIAILDSDGRSLLDTLVRPTIAVPSGAVRVHGIGEAMLASAPAWPAVWPQVQSLISGRPVAIYNAEFDLRLIAQTHSAHDLPWRPDDLQAACIMLLFARYRGEWDARRRSYRWHSLSRACGQMGLRPGHAHRARADADLTRRLLTAMAHPG